MSPDRRCQTYPVLPQKRPTVIATLHAWIWMTSPAHQEPLDIRFPCHSHKPPMNLPPHETPAQHPPSGPIPLSPGHVNQQCVSHYRNPRETHQPKTIRDLGSVAVGTRFREQRESITGKLGRLVCDRAREPTLHEALSNIMGAYHHSQETMGTVLDKFQETQRLQEEHYLGIREDLKSINTTLVTIAGVLADLANTMRDTVAHKRAPDTSLNDEQPSISAGDSGQEAPPTGATGHWSPTPCRRRTTPQTVPKIQEQDRKHCQDPHQEIRLS
ncbi:hypothetical protein NDU88_008036 [Pleurodeles waltl]|uniref:BLOC-1-related complex subunit 5 n=1 Tax=Pleurodeles waltl TaxID=8319 RepID=A0AAV7VW34_PLEWA|nr:hypothetical protein NDU88_008036 [Pleurodeles waltl]